MKIEFRKIPLSKTKFEILSNSVKFLGNFSKISSKLAKIDGQIDGNCKVQCCKCGEEFDLQLDEKCELLLCDGVFSSQENDEDLIVIEVDNHIVDFDSILQSELESVKSEYYICDNCQDDNYEIDKIY